MNYARRGWGEAHLISATFSRKWNCLPTKLYFSARPKMLHEIELKWSCHVRVCESLVTAQRSWPHAAKQEGTDNCIHNLDAPLRDRDLYGNIYVRHGWHGPTSLHLETVRVAGSGRGARQARSLFGFKLSCVSQI